jgi:hypothetical protein
VRGSRSGKGIAQGLAAALSAGCFGKFQLAGEKVRGRSPVAMPDGSVDVTVATAAGKGTQRRPAAFVRAQEARAARVASEEGQASRGAVGMIPLAAAARVPAYGGRSTENLEAS